MADASPHDVAKEDEDGGPPIRHHYVLVLVVQALTLSVLWVLGRYFS